ncbi:MAG: methyltransferase domain-containing protein [Candidatus Levyibacteriota bacterium]
MSFTFKLKNALLPQSDKFREHWVAERLSKIKAGDKILDAGAGECYYQRYCDHLKYTSQDFGKYDGKGDRAGIQTGTRDSSGIDIVSDIVDIPVKSASFDAVLCVEVFEHIPRPLDALSELSRVLKKGGTLILTAPFTSLTHYSPFYFYSGFSENFYKENLPMHGFKIKQVYSYGNYFDGVSLELARTPLVIFREDKLLFLILFLLFPLLLPAYVTLRVFSHLFPKTSSLSAFGVCIEAYKE